MAPLAIGLALSMIHFASINATGTSVNPARSIGVALFAGSDAIIQLWLFILAPLLGGALAGLAYPVLFGGDDPVPGSGLRFAAGGPSVPCRATAPRTSTSSSGTSPTPGGYQQQPYQGHYPQQGGQQQQYGRPSSTSTAAVRPAPAGRATQQYGQQQYGHPSSTASPSSTPARSRATRSRATRSRATRSRATRSRATAEQYQQPPAQEPQPTAQQWPAQQQPPQQWEQPGQPAQPAQPAATEEPQQYGAPAADDDEDGRTQVRPSDP